MKKVDVYYSGWGEHWKLGQLADNKQQIFFEYTPEALHRGVELSPLNLKLRSSVYGGFPFYQMRLPGLVADSLPDGWGLFLMDKLFRKQGIQIEDVSPLDRLSFLGNRAMGALSFEPSSQEGWEHQDFTILEIAKEVHQLVTDHASKALNQLAWLGGSPHGARPKVLVNYDSESREISTDPIIKKNPWIIKFPGQKEHPEVCAIEKLYSDLAREVGLEIGETEYFDLGKNLSAFGMQRFDREKGLRIPTLTVAGALDADFRMPSSVDYLSFLRLTRLMTQDEREVLKAFRQCVFNVVFNNRDDHSKNFSFLLDRKKNWKLTPAYDLTYSEGPGGEHTMDICGEGRSPEKSHLIILAEKCGFDKKTVDGIADPILEIATQFKSRAKNRPIRRQTVSKIEKVISAHIKRLSSLNLLLSLLFTSLFLPWYARADSVMPIPGIMAESLEGKSVQVPADLEEINTWLMIGFTRGSRKATIQCSEKLEQDFKGKGFQLAVLEGVPFFLKGLIRNRINSIIPLSKKSKFFVTFKDRENIEKLAGFQSEHPDDAYILGFHLKTPGNYEVAWSNHGNCDPIHYSLLRKEIQKMGLGLDKGNGTR